MNENSGGPGGGSGSGPGSRHNPPHTADTVSYNIAGGAPSVLVSPSFLNAASAQACTVMLTRENPSVTMSKSDVSSSISAALQSETGTAHPIVSISKYPRDNQIICVRFLHQISAQTLLHLNSLQIRNVKCAVSKYGQRLVQLELMRVPVHATVEEVAEVVQHLGAIKSITRPQIQGYEDHKVAISIEPHEDIDLAEEQKAIFRPAIFSGETYIVQYCCLTQVVVCTACRESGHTNGPKCPMKNRCLTCNEQGHMKRECPQRRRRGVVPTDGTPRGAAAFPDAETVVLERQVNTQGADHAIPIKTVAPPPPPLCPDTLASTGLPPLLPEGPTSWSDLSPLSKGDSSERSRSPLSKGSSETSSAEQQKQKLDYVKRGAEKRAKELGIKRLKFKPKDLSCIRNTTVDNSHDEAANNNVNSNIPQFDGPTDSPIPPPKEEAETSITPSENLDGGGEESDNSYEQDSEVDDIDPDELQYLCFGGLDDYASESEANFKQKSDEKSARLREQLRAAQQHRNEQRRESRTRCLKASSMRVPPQLLGHRDLDWVEYIRGLPACCWPAQVSDMIALGLMAEDDPNPAALTCMDCKRSWYMRATELQDEAIFEPPHVLCEKQGLVCLKGHINCMH